MKKTSIGAAVAGAVLCVLTLAGCRGDGGSASGGQGGAATVSGAAVAATGSAASASDTSSQSPMTETGDGHPGDGVPSATPTGAAAVDSELDTVNQQLGTAGSDLAQATASPSDGG